MNNLDNIIKYNDECVSKFISLVSLEMKNGIQSIYNDTKDKNKDRKKILREFQQNLSNIPKWSETIVDNEYNRIKILSKCDFFDDLIQNIFKSYFKVLFLIKKKREHLNVPSSNKLIHHCYISLAREIWKKPILFYHKLDKKTIQKNHIEINNLIKHSIKIAIKDLLPFKDILKNYLNNDDDDSDDDYGDFEEYNLDEENKALNLVSNQPEDFIEEVKLDKDDENIIDNITEGVVDNVVDIVEGVVEDVSEGVVEDASDDDVDDSGGVVENVSEDVVEDVENTSESVVEDIVEKVAEEVEEDIDDVVEKVAEEVEEDIDDVVEGVVEKVDDVVDEVVEKVDEVVEDVVEDVVDDSVNDAIDNVKKITIGEDFNNKNEELINIVNAKNIDSKNTDRVKKKSRVKSSQKIEKILGIKVSKEEFKNKKKLRKKLLLSN